MLIGEFSHTIDPKGRVSFPSRLREDLGERFVVTKGLDECLFVYSFEEFASLESKINSMPMSKSRALQRFFFSGAGEAIVDKQGRILIPPPLREYAHLEKDIMIIGASARVEIWDKARWDSICAGFSADSIAAAMDELGF